MRTYTSSYSHADGLPQAPVAVTGETTYDFALATRQVFSQVTGQYRDYANLTTIIDTNVTLGALHALTVPVTFFANVLLDFNSDTCQIERVEAYAQVPTQVLGLLVDPPEFPQVL